MAKNYDFSGWATRNDIKCSDGRTIRRNAFKDCDGRVVPLVWSHGHNSPSDVLGHCLLENREEGVYTYGTFNDTDNGKVAKSLVVHKDVNSLSIYANHLQQYGGDVMKGDIKEVSLCLAGANPGAYIESVIEHDDMSDDYLTLKSGEQIEIVEEPEEVIEHADEPKDNGNTEEKVAEAKEKTIGDVFDEMTDEQKEVVYAMIGAALEEAGVEDEDEEEEEETEVKHNIFEGDEMNNNYLSHAEVAQIFNDAKRIGSLKAAVEASGAELVHDGIEDTRTTFPTNSSYLFPDARNLNMPPEFIKRKDEWVSVVMNGTHHTPFSRIKSMFADITADDARAKGYLKGNLKTNEVFTLLKRTTSPTTIYKKMKMDRDDQIDITEFDVVAWIKAEMRAQLEEEIARAILVGDGRLSSSNDKINELNIRPIWTDEDFFTIKVEANPASVTHPTSTQIDWNSTDLPARAFIQAAVRARKDYRGSGNPIMFTTEDMLTDCLLLEDVNGRRIYNTDAELASACRVSRIITVPVMENLTRTVTKSGTEYTNTLKGIIVNLNDYNVGADKGGAVSMFDDFDIDYNAQKYLIETRCSGALIKPYSAIVIETSEEAEADEEPQG